MTPHLRPCTYPALLHPQPDGSVLITDTQGRRLGVCTAIADLWRIAEERFALSEQHRNTIRNPPPRAPAAVPFDLPFTLDDLL